MGHGIAVQSIGPAVVDPGRRGVPVPALQRLQGRCSPRTGSNVWNTTLLIGWDEPGGTYDHVPPPSVPSPDPAGPAGQHGFTFDRSGYRVPAVIVPPWVAEGEVFNAEHRHTSLIATLPGAMGPRETRSPRATPPPGRFSDVFILDTPRDPATWPVPKPRPVPPFMEDPAGPGREPVHAGQNPGPGDPGVRGSEPRRDRGPAQGPRRGRAPRASCSTCCGTSWPPSFPCWPRPPPVIPVPRPNLMRGSRDRETRSAHTESDRPARPLREEPQRPDHRLQRPAAGVAAAVLRGARHLLPGPGGRRRGNDEPRLPRRDQPRRRRHGAGADGPGDHLVHGQGLRRAPEPGRQHRLRPAPRLPVATGPRLHRGAAGRGHDRGPDPARHHQRLGQLRVQLPRQGLFRRGRVLDGAPLDHRPGQRDPGHRVGRPERRRHRRPRGSAPTSRWPACGAAPSRAPR